MDSRATNHVIVDPTNLHHKGEYNGFDKLTVGNGQAFLLLKPIQLLLSLLHVPKKIDMLSIASLTRDNNVIVEFNVHYVFVKDQGLRKLLLEGWTLLNFHSYIQ